MTHLEVSIPLNAGGCSLIEVLTKRGIQSVSDDISRMGLKRYIAALITCRPGRLVV